MSFYLLSLLVILGIQIGFFIGAAIFKTDKVTDLAYGLTFVIVAILLLVIQETYWPVQVLVVGLITMWGLRLAAYLFVRILKTKRDKRFDGIREDWVKFASFWLLQTVTIFLVMLPSVYLLSLVKVKGNTLLTMIGLIMWLIGFGVETVADWQKFKFKNNPKNKSRWINTGLWKYARHPNYFGEILLWWGIFVITLPHLTGWGWLTMAGPIFISFLLLKVSGIPLLEKRYEKKYGKNPNYLNYVAKTRLLVPLPK